jgi:hypothetical protein
VARTNVVFFVDVCHMTVHVNAFRLWLSHRIDAGCAGMIACDDCSDAVMSAYDDCSDAVMIAYDDCSDAVMSAYDDCSDAVMVA